MSALQIPDAELSRLADEAMSLAKEYWSGLSARRAFPETSAEQTAALFARPWPEAGRGSEVLQDFRAIADHGRPSGSKFFAYVLGSAEPVGALGDLLASVLGPPLFLYCPRHPFVWQRPIIRQT